MKRLLLASIIASCLSSEAWAGFSTLLGVGTPTATACVSNCMITPILSLNSSSGFFPSNSATNYAAFQGATGGNVYNATLNLRQVIMPVTGTISNLEVFFPTTISSGSYAISLNKGGSSTALTCTVQSGTQQCSDSIDSVSVNAADLVTWQITPTGTPTVQAAPFQLAATFTSTVGQESPIFSVPSSANASNSATQYAGFGGFQGWNATENTISAVFPTAGTIDRLYVGANSTPGGSASYALTVMHNTAASTLTCTLTSAISTCSDLSAGHAITIAAGDTLSIQQVPTSTPTSLNIRAAVRWVPTTANQAVLLQVPSTMPSNGNTAARFMPLNGASAGNGTETNELNISPVLGTTMTIANLFVAQCPGPDTSGSGVTRSFTARSGNTGGALSNTTVTATMAASTTACPTLSTTSDLVHSFTVTSGQLIDFSTAINTATNAAALTTLKTGLTVTVP